jgi:hypothetical protein
VPVPPVDREPAIDAEALTAGVSYTVQRYLTRPLAP